MLRAELGSGLKHFFVPFLNNFWGSTTLILVFYWGGGHCINMFGFDLVHFYSIRICQLCLIGVGSD